MTNGTGTDVNEISGKYGIAVSGLDNFVATAFKGPSGLLETILLQQVMRGGEFSAIANRTEEDDVYLSFPVPTPDGLDLSLATGMGNIFAAAIFEPVCRSVGTWPRTHRAMSPGVEAYPMAAVRIPFSCLHVPPPLLPENGGSTMKPRHVKAASHAYYRAVAHRIRTDIAGAFGNDRGRIRLLENFLESLGIELRTNRIHDSLEKCATIPSREVCQVREGIGWQR